MVFGCSPFPPNPFNSITLTGLTGGGPVSPDANGNINLGGSNIAVVGDPATNTLVFLAPGITGIDWVTITSSPVVMSVNTGYIDRFVGSTNYMLPTTSAIGDVVIIVGVVFGYEIHPADGQSMFLGVEEARGPGGFITSYSAGNSIYLVCTIDNVEWRSVSIQGGFVVTTGP